MRSNRFLRASQIGLVFDLPGLIAGVDEAGRGPLAGPVLVLRQIRIRQQVLLQRQVQQVANTLPVRGRDRMHFTQPQLEEFRQLGTVLHAFGLVGHQDANLAKTPQITRNFVVLGRDTFTRVHHEQHHIGLRHGLPGLFSHLLDNAAAGVGLEATSVDGDKFVLAVFAVAIMPVARKAGEVGHDGIAGPGQAIEQRRLAHVGATDQGQYRLHELRIPAVVKLTRAGSRILRRCG